MDVLRREHLSHKGAKKTILDIAAKYYWPGFEMDVKKMVGECMLRQTHRRSEKSEP